MRDDPTVAVGLPTLPTTSTVGRAKDRVSAERSRALAVYLEALCALPHARCHPAFQALLAMGKKEESSRQQLLTRVNALEMEVCDFEGFSIVFRLIFV